MGVRMAERGRPKAELVLSEEERDMLGRWAKWSAVVSPAEGLGSPVVVVDESDDAIGGLIGHPTRGGPRRYCRGRDRCAREC